MTTHDLKIWPSQFEAVKRGDKTFEVRSNTDRDFAVGDTLLLRKWDPDKTYAGTKRGAYIGAGVGGAYTVLHPDEADTLKARVTYILYGGQFGLPVGLCVMSIKVEEP